MKIYLCFDRIMASNFTMVGDNFETAGSEFRKNAMTTQNICMAI